jgi:hypothetical protein
MSDEADKQKTERIGWLCVTMVILGLFFMLTKTNACALACNSCNAPSKPDICKDEFFELSDNARYGNNHSCTPGARAEVVSSPPAPKPGIICHCINKDQGGQATQDAGK